MADDTPDMAVGQAGLGLYSASPRISIEYIYSGRAVRDVLLAAAEAQAQAGTPCEAAGTRQPLTPSTHVADAAQPTVLLWPCAASAARQVGVLDAKLRAAAAALAPALDAASDTDSSDPLDPVALRLQANGVRPQCCAHLLL